LYNRGASRGVFKKGNKYLAVYDSLNPKSGELLLIDITDKIYKEPFNGWKLKDIPFKVDTIAVKKMLNE
jgi:hypothetical protein